MLCLILRMIKFRQPVQKKWNSANLKTVQFCGCQIKMLSVYVIWVCGKIHEPVQANGPNIHALTIHIEQKNPLRDHCLKLNSRSLCRKKYLTYTLQMASKACMLKCMLCVHVQISWACAGRLPTYLLHARKKCIKMNNSSWPFVYVYVKIPGPCAGKWF